MESEKKEHVGQVLKSAGRSIVLMSSDAFEELCAQVGAHARISAHSKIIFKKGIKNWTVEEGLYMKLPWPQSNMKVILQYFYQHFNTIWISAVQCL